MHIELKDRFKKIRTIFILPIVLVCCSLSACFPEKVDVDATDFEMLDLPAKSGIKGITSKKIQVFGRVFAKNTRVIIEETWLKRLSQNTAREKKSGFTGLSQKKGYKIRHYYQIDSSANRSFILPTNSVDVFYQAHLEGDPKVKIVIPQKLLLVDGS